MLGLRDVSFICALEGNDGEYTAADKTLNVNTGAIDSLARDKAKRHTGLQGKMFKLFRKQQNMNQDIVINHYLIMDLKHHLERVENKMKCIKTN